MTKLSPLQLGLHRGLRPEKVCKFMSNSEVDGRRHTGVPRINKLKASVKQLFKLTFGMGKRLIYHRTSSMQNDNANQDLNQANFSQII